MENKKKLIVVLLIVNIAVVIYYGQNIKNELRAVKVQNDSNYNNVLNQVITQGNNLSSSMKNLIRESDNIIADYNYTIIDTDLEQKMGKVEIELLLKETSANSKIIGELKALDGSISYTIEFERVQGLTYRSLASVALDKNYEVQIYEQQNDGASRKLSNNDLSMLLYNEVYADRIQSLESGTIMSDTLTVHHDFRLTNENIEGTDIVKVMLQAVDLQKNIIAEYDITNNVTTKTIQSAELEDRYKVALASGQLDYEMTFDEYLTLYGNEFEEKGQSNIQYHAEKTFTKDELNEVWDMFNSGTVYFTLKILFEDNIEVQL